MKSILLVEDDKDVRSALGEFLSQEGYAVATAANGSEAFAKIQKEEPGLVLLDLMMPVMSGWEFLERKSHIKELANLPVLVLSAVPGKPYIPGALACLKKPIDLNRLLDFVELYCA